MLKDICVKRNVTKGDDVGEQALFIEGTDGPIKSGWVAWFSVQLIRVELYVHF